MTSAALSSLAVERVRSAPVGHTGELLRITAARAVDVAAPAA